MTDINHSLHDLMAQLTGSQALILASTSPYRRELLSRLQIPFTCIAPEVDETPLAQEAPAALAARLALAKARAIAVQVPHATVIGSDQVADLAGQALGKPGTHERAVAQWRAMRGQTLRFYTSVAVVRQRDGFVHEHTAVVEVKTRGDLRDTDIENYLRREQPYDCAGAAKSEGLGISMLEAIHSDDPTALIGLPLIATARVLRLAGFALPAALA